VRRSWGKSPPHFEKLRVAKLIPLLALNLRKKAFYLKWKHINIQLAKGIRIFG
jgi:hypothetical protein